MERFTKPGTANVSPSDRAKLKGLLAHYAKMPHPFTACVPAGTPVDCPRDHARYPDGIPIERLRQGDLVWSFNEQVHVFELAPVVWAERTRQDAQLALLVLDSGARIKATPDHRFMGRDGVWTELQDLHPGDSLMPLYRDAKPLVRLDPNRLSYTEEYRAVGDTLWPNRDTALHIHHRDERHANSHPDNLEVLTSPEHTRHHHATVREVLAARGERRRCKSCGVLFAPKARQQTWCGECPEGLAYMATVVGTTKDCKLCATPFVVRSPNHAYCSAKCRHREQRGYVDVPECKGCGVKLGHGRFVWCEACARSTARPMTKQRICAQCGSEFKPRSGIQRHCSAECRVAHNAHGTKHRVANHRVAAVELLDERADVWDMEVAHNHSFVVHGVVLHNCYRDQLKHGLSKDHAARRCAVLKDLIRGSTDWRKGKQATNLSELREAVLYMDASGADCEQLKRARQVLDLAERRQQASLDMAATTAPPLVKHRITRGARKGQVVEGRMIRGKFYEVKTNTQKGNPRAGRKYVETKDSKGRTVHVYRIKGENVRVTVKP